MITGDGLNLIYNNITNNLLKGQVLINGQFQDVPIQKTETTSNSIKIYIYLDENYVGQITGYRIISTDGKTFLERSENVTKDDTRGLLVLFEITLQEV